MYKNIFAVVLVICILFLLGCQSLNEKKTDYVVVYKTIDNLMEPNYIILKVTPKTSELYIPTQYTSVFGEWSYLKDTIYIKPQYIYDLASSSQPSLKDVNIVDSSVISISQKYLVKGDILIDITDYSIVHPMLKESQTKYKRVK